MLILGRTLLLTIVGLLTNQEPNRPSGATAKDASRPQSPTEIVDELIERTNKLEAFVAKYHMTLKDGAPAELQLLYQGPDHAKFTISGEKISLCMCIRDATLEFRSKSADETPVAGLVEGADWQIRNARALRDLLKAAFPKSNKAGDVEVDGGLAFDINFKKADGEEESSVSFGLTFVTGRIPRLGWLRLVRDLKPLESDSTSSFTYAVNEDVRFTLSRESGFFEKIVRARESGSKSKLELAELDLQPKLKESDFTCPAREPGTRDVSDALRQKLFSLAFDNERQSLYRALRSMVDEHRLEWNAETIEKTRAIVLEIWSANLGPMLASWTAAQLEWISRTASWAEARAAALEPADQEGRHELKEMIAKQRTTLESAIDKALESSPYAHASIPAGDDASMDITRDLTRMSQESMPAAFKQVIAKPLLDTFDEKVAKKL